MFQFLGHKNVLVIGQGNIGKLVAHKLRELVNVLTYDPIFNEESELKDLISQSDVITLHIPLNSNTKGFIDKNKLALMKENASLINTSRGQIVDENALYQEMVKGRVFAAFDVFWNEPYNGILKSFYPERFYMTPHIASNCINFLEGLAMDLKSYLRTLANNWIDNKQLYHKKTANFEAKQYFTNIGPLAFLPLSSKITSVVLSAYNNRRLEDQFFKNFLLKFFKDFKVKKFSEFHKAKLNFSLARKYYFKNIF